MDRHRRLIVGRKRSLRSTVVPHSLSPRRRARLVRQLRVAHDSLVQWEESLRLLAAGPAPGSPHNAAELLGIVSEAKLGLNQLLAEMGATAEAAENAAPTVVAAARTKRAPRAPERVEAPHVCVNACRACGRVLGAAFREAQRAADAAAAKILYGSLRALEKQIWVLDPRQAD